MNGDAPRERVRKVGVRLNALALRILTTVIVLVIFIGLAFLVYANRVDQGALLLYAGVIIGYLIHMTKQTRE